MTLDERDVLLALEDMELLRSCTMQFTKGTGNGGQKRNKTSSAVRITHIPTNLTVYAADSRSQVENRHTALKRLRMEIALNVRAEDTAFAFQAEPEPSLSNPGLRNPWIARLFDLLEHHQYNLASAAETAGLSRSKLEKLLRRDEHVWRVYMERKNRFEL